MRVVNIMVGRVFMLLCNFVFISSVMMGQSDDSREGMEDIVKYISMEVISDHASMDSDFIKLDIRNKSPYRIYYGASYHFRNLQARGGRMLNSVEQTLVGSLVCIGWIHNRQ